VTFFLLRDGGHIGPAVTRAIPLEASVSERLTDKSVSVTRATIKGSGIVLDPIESRSFTPWQSERLMSDKRIVAVGLLTQPELDRLGETMQAAYRIDDSAFMGELLNAIDDADRAYRASVDGRRDSETSP